MRKALKLIAMAALWTGVTAFALGAALVIPKGHWRKVERKTAKRYGKDIRWLSIDSTSATTAAWNVLNSSGDTLARVDYRKVEACSFGGCTKTSCGPEAQNNKVKEYIYYVAVRTHNNPAIQLISVLEYESNYGFQIASSAWLRQFVGLEPGQAVEGETVDGISGATVSVQAMISDVNNLPDN